MWPFFIGKNMNITDEQEVVVFNIFKYFNDLGYSNVIIYGSYIEQMYGFNVTPNDIDVCLVIDDEPPENRHKSFYLGFTDIVINVEIMKHSSFELELKSMQPKYFMCIANTDIQKDIDFAFSSKKPHEVRTCISSITSRAFDKGRKKLLVENDYDEVLGLKNLYHAFKFPYYALWFYSEIPDDEKEHDIEELNTINSYIYETYSNSTGSLEERCKKVVDLIKPKHNALMTEFRTIFPKEV
jgi:hypothetical protein